MTSRASVFGFATCTLVGIAGMLSLHVEGWRSCFFLAVIILVPFFIGHGVGRSDGQQEEREGSDDGPPSKRGAGGAGGVGGQVHSCWFESGDRDGVLKLRFHDQGSGFGVTLDLSGESRDWFTKELERGRTRH